MIPNALYQGGAHIIIKCQSQKHRSVIQSKVPLLTTTYSFTSHIHIWHFLLPPKIFGLIAAFRSDDTIVFSALIATLNAKFSLIH